MWRQNNYVNTKTMICDKGLTIRHSRTCEVKLLFYLYVKTKKTIMSQYSIRHSGSISRLMSPKCGPVWESGCSKQCSQFHKYYTNVGFFGLAAISSLSWLSAVPQCQPLLMLHLLPTLQNLLQPSSGGEMQNLQNDFITCTAALLRATSRAIR